MAGYRANISNTEESPRLSVTFPEFCGFPHGDVNNQIKQLVFIAAYLPVIHSGRLGGAVRTHGLQLHLLRYYTHTHVPSDAS